jgi:hypothetical protein
MAKALRWWRANRPAAPGAPDDDIDGALELVAQAPAADLYYAVDVETAVVQLLAFRHTRRRTAGTT